MSDLPPALVMYWQQTEAMHAGIWYAHFDANVHISDEHATAAHNRREASNASARRARERKLQAGAGAGAGAEQAAEAAEAAEEEAGEAAEEDAGEEAGEEAGDAGHGDGLVLTPPEAHQVAPLLLQNILECLTGLRASF